MLNESGMNGASAGESLSGAEALELSAQLAGLARAGLPLAPSLAALADELPRGRLRRSMRDLALSLESGQPLGKAVEGQERRLPPHLRGLMLAGIRSGRLGEVLGEFSGFATLGVELRRRLWLNLAYPVLTLLLTLSVFAFVGIAVLPQFQTMFGKFGMKLPRVTLLILEFTSGTAAIWPAFAAMAGALVVGGLAAHLFLPPAIARSLAGRVPLLGGVWRWTSLAEFSHLLALLLEHRLPMPEALRLAGEGVQDARIEVAARHMAEDVEEGQTLAGATARRREFPPRLPRLLRWGENQGTLPEVLHMAGEMFAARASAHASFASTAVSMACFLMVLTGVALIVSGLLLPVVIIIYNDFNF
jgi:type II secretory pathway component PulF